MIQQMKNTILSVGLLALTCASFLSPSLRAENLFIAESGGLSIPVLRLSETEAYSVSFSLASSEPLIWAFESLAPTTADTRTAASFSAESGSITIPELTVGGELYTITFNVTGNCDADFCLEPDLTSVAGVGRSGEEIFSSIQSSASTFTCSTCHALSETNGFALDGFRRPGHSLLNSTRRENYKNGALNEMLDAVNTCLTEWMNTEEWISTNTDWINLYNWLDDQSDSEIAEAVTIDVVAVPETLSGGDAITGQALFNTRCVVCHGIDGVGTQLAPKITDIGLQADYIARRVRTSGRADSSTYTGLTGGIMPFWGADRLSDGELVDIIAWLAGGQSEVESPPEESQNDPSTASGCSSTHSRIGQTATLSTQFHKVSGTATVIDDCTIEISGFNYDGQGINVQIYAAHGTNFTGGLSLSGNLLGTAYVNETLTITLPEGITLDDFDSISVWCVPVGVSFGHGTFVIGTIEPEVSISY